MHHPLSLQQQPTRRSLSSNSRQQQQQHASPSSSGSSTIVTASPQTRWYMMFLIGISLLLVFFILLVQWRFSHVFDNSSFSAHKQHPKKGPHPKFVFPSRRGNGEDHHALTDVDDEILNHEVEFVHRGEITTNNNQTSPVGNNKNKKNSADLPKPPKLNRDHDDKTTATTTMVPPPFFYYPKDRPAVDESPLDCNAAKILQDEHNKATEDQRDRTAVLPCVRVLMFSTLKPCLDDDAIWSQFAAVASWSAAYVYPAPTIVLYDTSLVARRRKPTTSSGAKKEKDEEKEDVVVHGNFDEAEHVVQFAKDNGIDLFEKDQEQDDDLENGNHNNDRAAAPRDTNATAARSSQASSSTTTRMRNRNVPPQSVQRSCGWLLAKMVEAYFPLKITVVQRSKYDSSREILHATVFPRVTVVAPTPNLVGPHHRTLLLSRALRHLSTVVAPALRPREDSAATFDIFGFVNSDIVFGATFGPVLANAFRIMRTFMLVGRRQSLSMDELRDVFRVGFQGNNKKKKKINDDDDNNNDNTQQQPHWPGESFYKTFFYDARFVNSLGHGQQKQQPSLLQLIADKDSRSSKNRRQDRIDAEDYFFWTRGFLNRPAFPWSIPPFHIGRPAFDNWLVSNSIHSMQPVVDVTASGLVAVHIEKGSGKSKNKKGPKNNNNNGQNDDGDVHNGDDGKNHRAYWSADDASTKENYRLGETHGGWQHGLLEFVPLEMHWLTGKENSADDLFMMARDDDNDDRQNLEGNNKKSSSRRLRHQQQHHRHGNPDKLLFHEKGDVRVGMKPSWKGITVDAGGGGGENDDVPRIGAGGASAVANPLDMLKVPHEYWKYIQKFF